MAAWVLDQLVWFPLWVLIVWLLGRSDGSSTMSAFLAIKSWIFFYLGLMLYFVVGEAWGGTVGKRLLALRTVNAETGRRLGFLRALGREIIARTASRFSFGAGYFKAFTEGTGRTWHDSAVNAQVVCRNGKL